MTATIEQAGLFAPPSASPDPYDAACELVAAAADADYEAFAWSDASPKKSTDDKVREALRCCPFAPAYVDTSCPDCPGELAVDGIAVRGQTWIQRGMFYLVRRP